MKKFVTALALTALLASPAFAHSGHHRHHRSLLGWRSYQHRPLPPGPAGTSWRDWSRWGAPPVRTGAIALAQDGQHYARVDSYDVVLDGRIVGRDPVPNIRFQLLREAGRRPDHVHDVKPAPVAGLTFAGGAARIRVKGRTAGPGSKPGLAFLQHGAFAGAAGVVVVSTSCFDAAGRD